MYRLIISEKSRDPYGRTLEILGSYNPFSKEISAKNDRISYWLSKGATMTPTINNLLVDKKIIEGKKVTAGKPTKKALAAKKAAEDHKTAKEAKKEEATEEKA